MDVYELSPTQEGMLFHALHGEATGVDLEQIVCSIRGAFDAAAFVEACQKIWSRHPILRTRFSFSEDGRPTQEVMDCGPDGSCIRFRQLPDSSRQPGAVFAERRMQDSR